MAEIWGAAITVGGAVISGMAASKKAKEDRKNANEDRKAMTKEDAQYNAVLSQFDAEQEDYFNQLNRQRKQRGLDQFRSYNTIASPDSSRIALPTRPDVNAIISATVPEEEVVQKAKKKRSTINKILDPLGGILK